MRLITALLASAFALSATAGEAQLLPAGKFSGRDGRPGKGKHWSLSDAQGERLAASINEVATQTPIVIDYDHQTIRADKNGQAAPAAGWILSTEWRNGKGLFAKVDWTPKARAAIDAKEYLYISPVIVSDDATGEVTGVLLAALVNHPALLGMEPVVAQLAAQFTHATDPHQETHMDLLAALIKSLGLKTDAQATDVIAAVDAQKARPAVPVALSTVLGLQPAADEAAAIAAATALKAKPAVPVALSAVLGLQAGADEAAAVAAVTTLKGGADATKNLLVTLQGQVNALTAASTTRGLTELLDKAVADQKIAPASRAQYEAIGKSDMVALTALIAALPAIPGLNGQTNGIDPSPKADLTALSSADALKVAAAMGIDPEAWKKSHAAQAATA
ncbi:MAG: phage protease [Burkholderiaceae bacterium]